MSFAAGDTPTAADLNALGADWADWTPTYTNLTVGNGSATARYQQVNKTVHYRFMFTLGTTSAVGTGPRFTLPVAPAAAYILLGVADLTDTGVANRFGWCRLVSGSTLDILWLNSTVAAGITATSPHTWGTTDTINVVGTYEAA
jgi:hypothetical protein